MPSHKLAPPDRRLHVGIIGAGFAGLKCADVLLSRGCSVTILEARGRLGGRVLQSDKLGHLVDLGPNFIHGEHDDPIMQLAKSIGLTLYCPHEDCPAMYNASGELLSVSEATEHTRLVWDEGLVSEAFRHARQNASKIDARTSLYDFFKERIQQLADSGVNSLACQEQDTLLHVASLWGTFIGSPVQQQSLKFCWFEECIDGENTFVADTYAKILEAVARPAREAADIKLNTIATRIRYMVEDVRLAGQVEVEVQSGELFHFDDVVVTTPLGWLKRNQSAFEPLLPQHISSAINNIGYGSLEKVYFTFPSAFWNQQSLYPISTSSNTDSAPQFHHWPDWTYWLFPKYTQATNPVEWFQECLNMAALPAASAHPTLLFYTYGPCSAHIAKLLALSPDPSARDEKLWTFFKPYISRLPNYSPSDPDCLPSGVLATAWNADEFSGNGSYSNFQVGLVDAQTDIENMRHGLPEHGLWFAGEHTAPFDATATTTGAWLSGLSIGERLCNAYGLSTT